MPSPTHNPTHNQTADQTPTADQTQTLPPPKEKGRISCRKFFFLAASILALGANEAAVFMLAVPDLQARYFGLFWGIFAWSCLTCGLVFLRTTGRCFGCRVPRFRGLFLLAPLTGYAAGGLADSLYLGAFSDAFPFTAFVPLGVWIVLMRIHLFPVQKEQADCSETLSEAGQGKPAADGFPRTQKVFLAISCTGIFGLALWWSVPDLHREKIELPDGIYVYANDTVCDIPGLNLISPRWGGFVHTGICFLTRDPQKLNAECRRRGLPELEFFSSGKLADGYWVSDFNLDVCDRSLNITNYSSPAKPDSVPYPFDLEHWKNLLNGHSVNDRLAPAIQARQLPVKDPLAAWGKLQEFRKKTNARYPDGFIYSPIPYRGHFVRFFNCNSLVVGAADEILGCGKEAEEFTDMPFHFGGEKLSAGRELMAELRSEDFAERLQKERAAMQDPPGGRPKFLHRLLSLANRSQPETARK